MLTLVPQGTQVLSLSLSLSHTHTHTHESCLYALAELCSLPVGGATYRRCLVGWSGGGTRIQCGEPRGVHGPVTGVGALSSGAGAGGGGAARGAGKGSKAGVEGEF